MRNGQAALEYLFTYGWAFLAILITLGTLMYFGIFDTNSLRSSDCTFPPGAVCDDYTITDDIDPGQPQVRVILRNVFAADLELLQVNATERRVPLSACGWSGDGSWINEQQINITCNFSTDYYDANEFYDFVLKVGFRQQGHTYQHNITGSVRANAQ